ncbi:dynamin family protein [Magnetococcales bacterium HHB-1]
MKSTPQLERRLNNLEEHLTQENPVLLEVVQGFRQLDIAAYRLGLLHRHESFATRVPWWPMVSVLGTFSAGKSSFINSFLKIPIQRSGNQAVDDKFTVICFSKEREVRTLPGLALDADPRFPFYQISQDLERVAAGEGKRIDSYLQLKSCPTEKLRGKILIDSPGFDADDQRTSTLRITEHIMDLSDLILVFFDARHPEPGAMKDTLDHLVAKTIHRADSNKFLFILNQIDCTAQEDNLEEVVAAWQRSLAQSGLTAGRFFQIYNPDVANPIADDTVRERFQAKRAEDLQAIKERIDRVEVERAYRIITVLEHTARLMRDEVVPTLENLLKQWRKSVLISDTFVMGLILVIFSFIIANSNMTVMQSLEHIVSPFGDGQAFGLSWWLHIMGTATAVTSLVYIHFLFRKWSAKRIMSRFLRESDDPELREYVKKGFTKITQTPWRSIFRRTTVGWGGKTKSIIENVLKDTDNYVQNLNDKFADPSGNQKTES